MAAITSGTVTSFDTTTESDDASAHVTSEKVAFFMIESTASVNTVALKASHVILAIPSDTATTGVRVGLDVGSGVGNDDGSGVGSDIGIGVGDAVGIGVGAIDGSGDGEGVGTADGAAVGVGVVGNAVGCGVG